MKKRMLISTLIICLIVMLLPCTASAYDPYYSTQTYTLYNGQVYQGCYGTVDELSNEVSLQAIQCNGTKYTFSNLYVNCNIANNNPAFIFLDTNPTIILSGTNTIKTNHSGRGIGITHYPLTSTDKATLTICGNGSLTMEDNDAGCISVYRDLIIKGNPVITLTSSTNIDVIYARNAGNIIINNGTIQVSATGEKGDLSSASSLILSTGVKAEIGSTSSTTSYTGTVDYYTYSGKTYLSVKTDKVCKIGNTTYPTIASALGDIYDTDPTTDATNTTTITLTEDRKESISIKEHYNVAIDLNGYVLSSSGGCCINNSGLLTIKDSKSSAEHYFNYKKDGAWTLISSPSTAQKKAADTVANIDDETTVVKVLGGCITGGSDNSITCGGGIRVNANASLTMNGGNVVGNWNLYRGGGIGLYGDYSKAFLYGGSVIGNHTDCYANSSYGTDYCGGGLDLLKTGSSVTLGGNFRITNNTSGKYTSKDDNLRVGAGRSIIIQDGFTGTVGVATSLKPTSGYPTPFTGATSPDYIKCFFSDEGAYIIANKELDGLNFLTVSCDGIACSLDGRSYTTVEKAIAAAGTEKATLKILSNISECIVVPAGKNIVLDLNGQTISPDKTVGFSALSISNSGTMEITDTYTFSGVGKITEGGISNSGTMTITKATIDGSGITSGSCINNSGTLTIAGGTISGNTIATNGGGIYNSGTLTITGGTISGNIAACFGGGIYNSGTLTITGGTIKENTANGDGGGVYNTAAASITIGGAANITGNIKVIQSENTSSNLYLPDGKTLKLGTGEDAPASGMKVGITMGSSDYPIFISDSYDDTLDHSSYFFSDTDLIIRNMPTADGKQALMASAIWFDSAAADGSFTLAQKLTKDVILVLARYNTNGRLIAASATSLSTDASSGTAALPAGTGGTLKFYLVDTASYKPLAASISVSLS